jgi:hypothetical protein
LLLLVALAAVIRFTELGRIPLAPEEAQRALSVWQAWQPGAGGISFNVSPAYFNFTSLLLPVLGDADAVMRLVPALAGVGLILLPWFWRGRIGVTGALIASLLLAISPTASAVARTAGGDAIALFALLLLLTAWLRYQDGGRPAWLYTSFAALGLGLSSAPLFLAGVATLALAWLAQAKLGPPLFAAAQGSLFLSSNGTEADQKRLRTAALVGATVFLAVATLFLWRPAGLAGTAALLGRWLAQFGAPTGLLAVLAPFLAFGRYELSLVILAALVTAWSVWRGYPLPLFLVYWFVAASLLILFQPGIMANMLLLVLPGTFLVSLWLGHLFAEPLGRVAWGVTLLVVVLGSVSYFNFARHLRVIIYSPDEYSYFLLAFLALAIAVVTINFVRSWDSAAAVQGTIAGLFLLFLLYQWGTAWWLTHEAANDPRESWVTVASDASVHVMVDTMREISRSRTGAAHDASVLSAVDSPVLRWYLRDFEHARFGDSLAPDPQQTMIITPVGEETGLDETYVGMDFNLLRTGVVQPEPVQATAPGEALRWWLLHEAPTPIQFEQVLLWVRAEAVR